MSYCRWSSDDHQCDIYAYEAETGFVVHVANKWVAYREALPESVSMSDFDVWWARNNIVRRMHDEAEHVDIGLEHDGESFSFDTAGECADCLVRLRTCGYNVPQYAIDALREEQSEDTP